MIAKWNEFLESFMGRDCTKVAYHGWINCDRICRNSTFQQLYHAYPQLEPFYFDFEKYYDGERIFDMMVADNFVFPTICVLSYLALCYYGPIFMKNRKPYKVERVLAAWNLFLTLFSVYGMIRMVPHTLWNLFSKPYEDTVCEPAHTLCGGGAAGLAIQLFCLSKIPEFIDTVFIILRKKPLIFLHWYHHVSVMIFSWHGYVTEFGAGHYLASMNLTVHSIMYFYFVMQTLKMVPKWFPTWTITAIQIAQMFGCSFVIGSSYYFYTYGGKKYAPGECHAKMSNFIVGGIIYSSYIYLFIEFFVQRWIFGKNPEEIAKKSK